MAGRSLTEEEALRALHRASRVNAVPLVVGWLLAGTVLVAVRLWLRDSTLTGSLLFGGGIAGLALLVQLAAETRRAAGLRHTREWTHLERATVTARSGRKVSVRGRGGRSVTAPVQAAWSLDADTPVWVGPRLATGERIVLVRDSSAAWASPVHAATGEAIRT
ncbi:hypothetical protein [Ornithinimicrobium cerasi]|uniref:hypothetical protein n=1 Tax=Ornithinimicrobium cerasi TaxID=2248773 RepID=UPI000EFE7552|nr:hypothetical protein [Ornithinimicrobium cerasi]